MKLLVMIAFSPFLLMRWLRWLAVVQQKEYRWDRWWSFWRSSEGVSELLRWPRRSDMTRFGMKRPVRTGRVLVVGGLASLILVGLMVVGYRQTEHWGWVGYLMLVWLFVPLLVGLGAIPTSVVRWMVTGWYAQKASTRLADGKPVVIGITGSYGKTATKLLLSHVLGQKQSVFTTTGSYNVVYSVAKNILVRYRREKVAILEYGAYKQGEIAKLARWFPPQIAMVTGVTDQHLALFGSREQLIEAKSELVQALPASGVVFCQAADLGAVAVCSRGNAQVIPYSGARSIVRLQKLKVDPRGFVSFRLGRHRVQTKLVGAHYGVNVQGVVAVCKHLGMKEEEIAEGLRTFQPSNRLIRSIVLESGGLVIDDQGTSNPKGVEAVIDLASSLSRKRKVLLFGGVVDLGDKSRKIHRRLAQKAQVVFSEVWYVGMEGKEEFKKVFGDRLIDDQAALRKKVQLVDTHEVLVVEGFVPRAISALIQKVDDTDATI